MRYSIPFNVIFACATLLVSNIGYASQAFFIDPSSLTDGDGTKGSPWNTFLHVNPGGSHTFSGAESFHKDNSSNAILIKSDTEIRESLTIQFGDNFLVGSYGSGEFPIINGSDIVVDTWVQEGDLWRLDSQTNSHALYVKSSTGLSSVTDIQLKARNNKEDVSSYQQWYDSSTQRLYADFGGKNPNSLIVELSARNKVVHMLGCHNYAVMNLHAMKGDNNNLVASNVTDQARWINNKSTFAGNWGSGGRSAMSIYGPQGGAKSTGVIIKGNVIRFAQNTGIEMGNLDGALIEGNDIQHVGMGIELWETVINSRYSRNRVRDVETLSPDGGFSGHGNGIWLAPNITSSYGGYNDNNIFDYNIILRTVGSSVSIKSGKNNKFYNNVFSLFDEMDTASQSKSIPMFYIGSSDGASASTGNILKNNTFYQRTQHRFLTTLAGGSTILDNNQYYTEYSGGRFAFFDYSGIRYSAATPSESFDLYKSSTNQDGQSAYGDPLLADIDNDDLRIYPASPLIDNGVDVGLSVDFNGDYFDGIPDKGAIEYQITQMNPESWTVH